MVGGVADAVVIPGAMFGPAAGLLTYAAAVAERRAVTVHRHCWSQQPPDPLQPQTEDWVRDQISPLLHTVGGHPLLIAKSLGTTAAAVAAERNLPAVWLTPILTLPRVTAALHRATAPFLLVGGTADAMWEPTLARRLSPHVLEIDGADHGLFVPGPLTGSIAVLGRLVTTMEEFIDAIGWPA